MRQHTQPTDHLARAYSLLDLGQYALALVEVQAALTENPQSVDAHICGAWVLRGKRSYTEAEQAARAALACDPASDRAYHVLAIVLWSQGRYSEAEQAFLTALNSAPADRSLYLTNYARMLNAIGRYAEAEAHTEESRTINPFYASTHEVRGHTLYNQGRYSEAEAAYHEALRIDPRNATAHEWLGSIALLRGRGATAAENLREALRLEPDNDGARTKLILALKACYPFYGRVLALTMRSNSPHGRSRWRKVGIRLGILMIVAVVIATIEPLPATLREFAKGIVGLIIGTLMISIVLIKLWHWLSEPVLNSLLMLDADNRHVIPFEPADAITAAGIAATLLGTLLTIVLLAVLGAKHGSVALTWGITIVSALAIILAQTLYVPPTLLRRAMYIFYTLVVFGALCISAGISLATDPIAIIGVIMLMLTLPSYFLMWTIAMRRR